VRDLERGGEASLRDPTLSRAVQDANIGAPNGSAVLIRRSRQSIGLLDLQSHYAENSHPRTQKRWFGTEVCGTGSCLVDSRQGILLRCC
jgi:hypothetical protein